MSKITIKEILVKNNKASIYFDIIPGGGGD